MLTIFCHRYRLMLLLLCLHGKVLVQLCGFHACAHDGLGILSDGLTATVRGIVEEIMLCLALLATTITPECKQHNCHDGNNTYRNTDCNHGPH